MTAVTLALGILALWLVPSAREKVLVVALLLLSFVVYLIANANHRFRVPFLPFLFLYSGPLLSGFRARDSSIRWRAAAGIGLVVGVGCVVATGS